MTKHSAPLQFVCAFLLSACAGSGKPTPESTPARDVRVLGKGDVALRRISFAAADYLKSLTNSAEVGFSGVYHNHMRDLDVELTRDIVTSHAFVDVSNGGRPQDANGCASAPIRPRTVPARPPRDPSTGATTAAAPAPTSDDRACANAVRATYGFNQFRVAADSAYVETSGMTQGLSCIVLAVDMERGGWKVVTVKPTGHEACGK